jgi:hypothetical protein
VSLWAADKQIGGGRMDDTVALRFSFYAGMDVGRDNSQPGMPGHRRFVSEHHIGSETQH